MALETPVRSGMYELKYSLPSTNSTVCIPGCNLCCYPDGNGIGMTSKDLSANRQYNGNVRTAGGLEIQLLPIGANKHERFVALIPAEEVADAQERNQYAELSSLLNWGKRVAATTRCVHSNSIRPQDVEKIMESYNRALASYGFQLSVDDFDGVNLSEFSGCDVHEAPRSMQCGKACNYSTSIMPRLLREGGKEFFMELLRARTLKERYEIVNKQFKRAT